MAKIDEIFHAALQLKPEERDSFLEENCGHDTALYADVKALLVSYKEDDSFFEDSASALAAEMFADRVGETIGHTRFYRNLARSYRRGLLRP